MVDKDKNLEELRHIIAEKDKLIDGLKQQIGELKIQNDSLSTKIDQLNLNFVEFTKKIPVLNTTTDSLPPKQTKRRADATEAGKSSKMQKNSMSVQSSLNQSLNKNKSNDSDDNMELSNDNVQTNTLNLNEDSDHAKIHSTDVTNKNVIDSWANAVLMNNNGKNQTTPIQLGKMSGADYTDIINKLHAKFNGLGYKWVQLRTGALPRIFPDNTEIKQQITDALDSFGVEYNTYSERNCKRKAFIVRGLVHGCDDINIKSISDALSAVGITGESIITRFQTGHMKRNPNADAAPIYQVVLNHDVDEAHVSKIKAIGSFRVRFERMKNSSVIQCRRCQRFSHTAALCAFRYRCVQCNFVHGPGDCPRIANKNLPLACVNCIDAGLEPANHTANDIQRCSFYKQKIARGKNTNFKSNRNNDNDRHSNDNNKPGRSDNAISRMEKSINDNSRKTKSKSNGDETIHDPVHANNGIQQSKKLKKSLIDKYRPSIGNGGTGKRKNIGRSDNNSRSESGSSGHKSNDRIAKLIGVLIETLREFE